MQMSILLNILQKSLGNLDQEDKEWLFSGDF